MSRPVSLCHPPRPAAARGLCMRCYFRDWWLPRHPEYQPGTHSATPWTDPETRRDGQPRNLPRLVERGVRKFGAAERGQQHRWEQHHLLPSDEDMRLLRRIVAAGQPEPRGSFTPRQPPPWRHHVLTEQGWADA